MPTADDPETFPAMSAIVRTPNGTTVEITESAAYTAHAEFISYVCRCVTTGYRVEVCRA